MSETAVAIVATSLWVGRCRGVSPQAARIKQTDPARALRCKVDLSQAARQRSLNAYYLLLEGSREGIPIHFFNRGAGAGRQNVIFTGDPLSKDVTSTAPTCPQTGQPCSNQDFLLQRQLATFQGGARAGEGPEVNDEEIVRAMMAERVNTMSYEAATPQV